MNIDQLTAKFAQAYAKRASMSDRIQMHNGVDVTPMSPGPLTKAVEGASNFAPYLDRLNVYPGGEDPYFTQLGDTGYINLPSGNVVGRPIEARQNYGLDSVINPGSGGFWANPLFGDDAAGTGGAFLGTGVPAYLSMRALLNSHLFSPGNYMPGETPTLSNLTPRAANEFIRRTTTHNPLTEGAELSAQQGPKVTRPKTQLGDLKGSFEGLQKAMTEVNMSGPGVPPTQTQLDTARVSGQTPPQLAPTTVQSSRPNPKGGPIESSVTVNPNKAMFTPRLGGRVPVPTWAGAHAALTPPWLNNLKPGWGGITTGGKGTFRGYAPLVAGLLGTGIPYSWNVGKGIKGNWGDETGDPNSWFSDFTPGVNLGPNNRGAVLGGNGTIYETYDGRQIPIQPPSN